MTYKLPHPLDRPYQAEALEWIMNSDKKYLLLCAPTGFGKSSLAAATSIEHKTMALVLHKSLQSANYRDQYNFDILYGKSNYPCHGEKNIKRTLDQIRFLPGERIVGATAFDCGNPDCACPYQEQELACLGSNRVSLNYAKFLMSKPFTERLKPEYLFLDEAHNLPDTVIDFAGLTLKWENEFLKSNGIIYSGKETMLNHGEAMDLFRQCARAVDKNKIKQSEDLKTWRKWKRLKQRIDVFNSLISNGPLEDWYYEVDDEKLLIKPLSARYHFKHSFDVADKIVLMSATITPSIVSRLGIKEDEFDFMEVPNPWPVPTRLIYDLKAPAMNYKSSSKDKEEQAELISSILCPDSSGVIHVFSYFQAGELATRLRQKSNCNFIAMEKGMGTDEQYELWQEIRAPGTYCISPAFREGIDLGDDNVGIVAKIPYDNLAGNYEKAKLNRDQQWYLEKTAYSFQQSFGRFQRGVLKHYMLGAKRLYIADSAYHRLKSWLSNDFKMRIRKWNGE